MKTIRMKRKVRSLLATVVVTVSVFAPIARAEIKTWSGAAGDALWSTGGNWLLAGAPAAADNVVFGADGATDTPFTAGGVATSTVDAGFGGTINSLRYSNVGTYHNTSLARALAVQSTSATDVAYIMDDGNPAMVFVGSVPTAGANDAVYASIFGASLTVSNPNAVLSVTQSSETSGAHRATLDLTGVENFTAHVQKVLVGHDFGVPITRPTGTLILGVNNTITAQLISVADAYQNAGRISEMHFGQNNVLNVNRIRIALHKCIGTVKMQDGLSGATVKFRAFDGEGRQTSWEIGDEYEPDTTIGYFTSSQSTGILDMSGASVDALVDKIVLGRGQVDAPTRTGDGNGTLTFGGGTIDANRVEMGIQMTGGASAGRGILNINNDGAAGAGKLRINGDLVMAVQLPGNTETTGSTAAVTVNGGTLEVGGNAIDGGGTVTLEIKNGGTVDMMPTGDATPGDIAVDMLNLAAGSIVDYGILTVGALNLSDPTTQFVVGAGQAISPAGALTVAGGTLVIQGKLVLDVAKAGAALTSESLAGTVTLGGTLEVRRSGDALAIGDKFTLFASAVPAGTFTAVNLPTLGAGMRFENKLAVDGSIEVVADAAGDPELSVGYTAPNLTLSWPASATGYTLQWQTYPLNGVIGINWEPVPDVTGNSKTITVGTAPGVTLFRLFKP